MAGNPVALVKARQAKTLRHDKLKPTLIRFLDDSAWIELARKRGVILPRQNTPCTTAGMERWIKKLGWSATRYLKWVGGGKLSDFIETNAYWGLRAFVGLLLEQEEE